MINFSITLEKIISLGGSLSPLSSKLVMVFSMASFNSDSIIIPSSTIIAILSIKLISECINNEKKQNAKK